MGNDATTLPECGVARFLVLLDGPWATLIVRELLAGPRRFTQLKGALDGISAHTLTNRLRRFAEHGIVERTAYAELPPRVVYELTPLGRELDVVLQAMGEWAVRIDAPDGESGEVIRGRLDRACTVAAPPVDAAPAAALS